MGEVVSFARLLSLNQQWQREGKTVVFTNGVFDLLHVGHVRYLQQARALGDVLVVGVNSDASARRLKGPGHPVVCQEDRAEVLAALACVDYVIIFEETTANNLLAALQPQVYVKGGDYATGAEKALPEAALVTAYGGRVVLLPYVAGRSTTELLARIRGTAKPDPHT